MPNTSTSFEWRASRIDRAERLCQRSASSRPPTFPISSTLNQARGMWLRWPVPASFTFSAGAGQTPPCTFNTRQAKGFTSGIQIATLPSRQDELGNGRRITAGKRATP